MESAGGGPEIAHSRSVYFPDTGFVEARVVHFDGMGSGRDRGRARDHRIVLHHRCDRPRGQGRAPALGQSPDNALTEGGGQWQGTALTLNADGTLDGVQMAIVNKRMEAICAKMANTLLRTGRSGVLNSARDFSCCIVTAENRLLTVNESLPIHVLRGADMMCESMQEFHPDLKRGDAYLHNSPYHGCSHPADHTILVPVVDDEGVHRFTMVAKAHQADCGNSIATTYHGSARDVYEEGALIFPAVQIQRGYEDIEDIVRMCRLRIRVPDQWWGDYLAACSARRASASARSWASATRSAGTPSPSSPSSGSTTANS